MERLGYVRGIPEMLTRLGCVPQRVERFPYNINPLNETALVVVDKQHEPVVSQPPAFVSPISGRNLVPWRNCWYCPDDGHAFPVIADIPCFVVENSVLVSKLGQFLDHNP
jgi:uncharacterized protein YbaR (Trm112 family)